jgi:hypothetical protein
MTFNAGNMTLCEECDHLRCAQPDDGPEVFYCAKGKIDSTECPLFSKYRNAQTVATAVGKALELIYIPNEWEGDDVYRKERLTSRITDALNDYFPEVWDSDLTYEIGCPGNAAMKARVTS